MAETTSQILGHTALSRHLRAEDLDILSEHVTQRVVVPGTILFTEGGSAETLFVVASGRVELLQNSDGSRRSVVAVLRNGDFCGERALLEGAAHETSAVALDECTLFCLDSRTWSALSDEHPRVATMPPRSAVVTTKTRSARSMTVRVSSSNLGGQSMMMRSKVRCRWSMRVET